MNPTMVILHCSGSDIPAHDNPETIDQWHKERGFKRTHPRGDKLKHIGYQFVITTDGKVHRGRRCSETGAHCYGQNKRALGICLTGNAGFTILQHMAMKSLVAAILIVFAIAEDQVFPHNHFNKNKTCPNFELPTQWA